MEYMTSEHENHLVWIQLNTEQTLFVSWLSLISNGLEWYEPYTLEISNGKLLRTPWV